MLPDNVGHLFDVPLALIPDAPAVLQGDTVLTFAALDERCNRLASALRDLGVEAGHRVALMFSNDFRFLEYLHAALHVGFHRAAQGRTPGPRRSNLERRCAEEGNPLR
jgi:non-ribosomal peptide synthetase component E (peptide arylation enzyme)